MKGQCEHCGNPMKELWTTHCMYKGNWSSRRAFIRSTFDPPCALDQYDEDMADLSRLRNRRTFFLLVFVAAMAFLIWQFLRP